MLALTFQFALASIVFVLSALVISARLTIIFRRLFRNAAFFNVAAYLIAALLFSLIVIVDLAQF